MADNKQTPNHSDDSMRQNSNQTMQNEQAKASVGGNDRKTDQGQFDKNRQPEGMTGEKSAIGGGENRSQSGEFDKNRSETGEAGRARNELDENKTKSETSEQR